MIATKSAEPSRRYCSRSFRAATVRKRFLCRETVTVFTEETMLWTIVGLFLILWLLGFSFSIGGNLIHILLVLAIVVFVINLLSGRRGTA